MAFTPRSHVSPRSHIRPEHTNQNVNAHGCRAAALAVPGEDRTYPY
jgi:hypothetical protein